MMFALTRLFAAVAGLAQNVEALAGSIAEANTNFRARLSLDGPPEMPALDHHPAPDGPDVAETAAGSPGRPRGRRKAV
jgi:hypothetical protein